MCQQGSRYRCLDDRARIFLMADRTCKDFVQVLDPFYLCGSNPQFFTYKLPSDGFHRGILIRAKPLAFRHRAVYFPDRQVFVEFFRFGFWFPAGMATDSGFLRLPFLPCFLLRIPASGTFPGSTEKFPAEFRNGFIQVRNRSV